MYLSSFRKTLTGNGFLLSRLIPLDPAFKKEIAMRLKLITLLLTMTLVHAFARSIGQITLHEKNARLELVFRSIEHQTDFVFLYDSRDLENIDAVTVDLHKASIEDAMKTALKGLPLTYKIIDKTILVKKSDAIIAAPAGTSSITALPPPPPVKISGKVTNSEDGAPLPGASVRILNSRIQTLTDAEGNFTLTAPADAKVLLISYVGFTAQQITLTGSKNYSIRLAYSTKQMADVVVTDGYATQAKKSYTGSSAVISGAQNENKPFTTPQAALKGELPGVNATINSGQPGANVQVRIRGINSVSLDANPLYVVDGMIINSGQLSRYVTTSDVLAGMNADDIESITVLKDAAATAIYGSRGSNGVIVITTKKGRSGKAQFRFDTEVGNTDLMPLPAAGKPLTPDQYKTMFIEALTNEAGQTSASVATAANNFGLNGRSNDWYKLVTRTGTQQQYNLSVSGGGENTSVYTSAGYFKQQSTVIESDLQRLNFSINVNHHLTRRVSLGTEALVSNVFENGPSNSSYYANPYADAFWLRPYQLAYNADGTINSSSTGNTGFPGFYNPIWAEHHDHKDLSQTHILSSENLKWNLWDKLDFTSFFSIDYNLLEENAFENGTLGDGKSYGGRGTNDYTRYFNWLTRNQLEYRWNIPHTDDFYLDVTAGYETQKSQEYYTTVVATGFPATQPLLTSSVNASTPTTASQSFSDYTFISYYSRGSLNYKNKYSLSGSYRRDGSSRFGINNEFGNFWSIGGAWNVDEEHFFQAQHAASSMKVRASYGTTGNAGNGSFNYTWRPLAAYGASYNLSPGQNYSVLGNPNLTWESSNKVDAGTDIGFFNDRLTVSFDYYHTDVSRLISSVVVSGTSGFTTSYGNIGSMVNKGEEGAITGIPVKTRNFTWRTSFNISHNKNTMTSLANAPGANGIYWLAPGYDYYTYYVKLYAGVDPQTGNALFYTDGTKKATTTSYTAAKYATYKQADPSVFGGWTNTFTWKDLSLTADLYYNYGNTVYDNYGVYMNAGAQYLYNHYQYVYQHRWTTVGQKTYVPKFVAGGIPANGYSDGAFSSYHFYRGDFIRLRNVTIGYDLKRIQTLRGWGITRLYLYGRATNLWTKTYDNRLPFDPEASINGQYNIDLPQVRTYTLGLNVGF